MKQVRLIKLRTVGQRERFPPRQMGRMKLRMRGNRCTQTSGNLFFMHGAVTADIRGSHREWAAGAFFSNLLRK